MIDNEARIERIAKMLFSLKFPVDTPDDAVSQVWQLRGPGYAECFKRAREAVESRQSEFG